jgi:hypothetical protein
MVNLSCLLVNKVNMKNASIPRNFGIAVEGYRKALIDENG